MNAVLRKAFAFGSGVGIEILGQPGTESLRVVAARVRAGSARLLGELTIPDIDHQAAGVSIQAMHGPDRPQPALAAPPLDLGDHPGQKLGERRLELPFSCRQFGFVGMSRGRHPGRFFDDHDVRVKKANAHVVFARNLQSGLGLAIEIPRSSMLVAKLD